MADAWSGGEIIAHGISGPIQACGQRLLDSDAIKELVGGADAATIPPDHPQVIVDGDVDIDVDIGVEVDVDVQVDEDTEILIRIYRHIGGRKTSTEYKRPILQRKGYQIRYGWCFFLPNTTYA